MLTSTDIGKALEEVAPQSIVFTALPQTKIDFVREVLTNNNTKSDDIASIDDIILMSEDLKSFRENLSKNMTLINIKLIENNTRGQSSNETWYPFRKGVITASKIMMFLQK